MDNRVAEIRRFFSTCFEENRRIVFCGVGKSHKLGELFSSFVRSMGHDAITLHPTEALHGELGVLRSSDRLFIISKSGRTQELDQFVAEAVRIMDDSTNESIALGVFREGVNDRPLFVPMPDTKEDDLPFTFTSHVVLATLEALRTLCDVNEYKQFHPGGTLFDLE